MLSSNSSSRAYLRLLFDELCSIMSSPYFAFWGYVVRRLVQHWNCLVHLTRPLLLDLVALVRLLHSSRDQQPIEPLQRCW